MIADDKYINEISQIVDFSLPEIQKCVNDGKELYQLVEDKLEIYPVGIIPISSEFGYLFLVELYKIRILPYFYYIKFVLLCLKIISLQSLLRQLSTYNKLGSN